MATILVVDDHPSMRDAVRVVLESERHDVREARDGDVAIAEIRRDPPDLILLDLQVPRLGGLELLSAIRDEPTAASTPVVVMTATGEEGRRGALAAGAIDYLTKPFSPAALLQTVARALGAPGSPGVSP